MEPQILTLNCDALMEFRAEITGLLQRMVATMEEKDLDSGTLSAKIKVELGRIVNQDGEMFTQIRIQPKVSIKMDQKIDGDISRASCMELNFDVNHMPIVGTNQISMDEMLEEGKHGAA